MVVPVDELAHCIRESLTYLTQYGAVCARHQEGRGSVSSREAQTAYDFFEVEFALCGGRFAFRKRIAVCLCPVFPRHDYLCHTCISGQQDACYRNNEFV